MDPEVTAAVLVSLPEELPVNETIDLDGALRSRVRIAPRAVVLNGFIPQRFTDEEVASLAAQPSLGPLVRVHRERERASADALARLHDRLRLPVVTVPRLYPETFGAEAIAEVARHLEGARGGGK